MKIGLVIPWRETPSRVKPLEAVLEWYQIHFSGIEVFYTDRPGSVWNASASRNDGVKRAQEAHCDIIIMNDADTIPEIKSLNEAIHAASRDSYVHNPYMQSKYLDEEETERYLNKQVKLDEAKHMLYQESNGGIWVFRPEVWWEIGGMDENFKQWGFEDTAFELAHTIIKGIKLIKHSGYIYCLGHKTQIHDDRFNFSSIENRERFLLYYSANTPEKMLQLVRGY